MYNCSRLKMYNKNKVREETVWRYILCVSRLLWIAEPLCKLHLHAYNIIIPPTYLRVLKQSTGSKAASCFIWNTNSTKKHLHTVTKNRTSLQLLVFTTVYPLYIYYMYTYTGTFSYQPTHYIVKRPKKKSYYWLLLNRILCEKTQERL